MLKKFIDAYNRRTSLLCDMFVELLEPLKEMNAKLERIADGVTYSPSAEVPSISEGVVMISDTLERVLETVTDNHGDGNESRSEEPEEPPLTDPWGNVLQ